MIESDSCTCTAKIAILLIRVMICHFGSVTYVTSSRFRHKLFKIFMPKDYPRSVSEGYLMFSLWQALGNTFGAASGVLSTSALLMALGVGGGAVGAAVSGGVVNWILKDGLGQLGGVAFASLVSSNFDTHPKRWKMASSIAMDLSAVVEILTPLFPSMFLPMAAAASIGKNMSFLAASASRAGINKSFAVHSNLADVTAKAGSQTIVSTMIGTAAGVVLVTALQYAMEVDPMTPMTMRTPEQSHTLWSLLLFMCLSVSSLSCHYISLRHVTTTTLTVPTFDLIFSSYLSSWRARPRTLPKLLTPKEVACLEVLLAAPPVRLPRLKIGSRLDSLGCAMSSEQWSTLLQAHDDLDYVIIVESCIASVRDMPITHLLFKETATMNSVLSGLAHAHLLRQSLQQRSDADADAAPLNLSEAFERNMRLWRSCRNELYGGQCSSPTSMQVQSSLSSSPASSCVDLASSINVDMPHSLCTSLVHELIGSQRNATVLASTAIEASLSKREESDLIWQLELMFLEGSPARVHVPNGSAL